MLQKGRRPRRHLAQSCPRGTPLSPDQLPLRDNPTRSGLLRAAKLGVQQLLQPLGVGDLVLAEGKRARIQNVFLSGSRGYLAQLFFIDTAEDGTAPLHQLSLMPEALVEHPPLAQCFSLYGISPHLPEKQIHTRFQVNRALERCVGRSATFQPQMWPLFAMNILKMVSGHRGNCNEVKVRVQMWPGDQVVVYCHTSEGELNFNQYLVDVNFAIRQTPRATPPTNLPSPDQLMCALASINQLEVEDTIPVASPVKPVQKTSRRPVFSETEKELVPYLYRKVYVDSKLDAKLCVSLEAAGFPGSVCKILTRLGFQTPTLVQASSWPVVGWGRGLTIIVSPPNSGKTLAYLLPLVTKREVSHSREDLPHPRLVVVVPSSWDARAIHTRAVELMSAQSAHRRFRSCAAYKAQEKAIVEVLNGVEVLVSTPDCLLNLVEKTVAQLDSLSYLVLDDFDKLQKNFSTEISKILALCSSATCCGPVSVVVTTSQWSEDIEAVPALIADHTHLCSSPTHLVIACPIEATIRAGVKIVVIPCLECSPQSVLQQQLSQASGESHMVICVADMETANSVLRHLQTLCWSVAVVREGERETLEQLFQKHNVVIVTDDALPELIQTGSLISQVIHCQLSLSRAAFTSRLTLLYPAIHRGVPCAHSVLLTERWSKQAGLLREMMERTNQTPPQPLLDMANKLEKEREEKRKDFDLCYKLKAWGGCSESLCLYRHTYTSSPSSFPSPLPLDLPKDGSIKVKVHYISTATRWWVSLLGHAPLYRGAESVEPHDPDRLLKMSCDLAEYFTPERQRTTLHSVPSEGNYCTLRDRDGCFYRVRILKFSQPLEFMFHHREKALVRLIDVGEARIVDVSQLLELPQTLLSPPAVVFEVFVCGIRPTDSDPDWPPQAAEIMEHEYKNQIVHGRVALVSGETVWLHPVEKKVHHKVSNIVAALTSPQQLLKEARMGESNPSHLVNLANCLGLPLIRANDVVTIDDPCVSFASLKKEGGSCVEVCMSAVDSPNQFYLQPMATENRVIELENLLNQYEGVCSMVVQPLPVGSVCAALFSENKSWYRGCVLEVEGHESKIRFLDYGNVEWVMNHLVQPIHPSLLELPFQAMCATFGMDSTEWGAEAGSLLYEWTRELVLVCEVRSVAPSSNKLLHGPKCATVELFERSSCSGGRGTNVAMRLPGVKTPAVGPKPSSSRDTNPALEELCVSLSGDQSVDEREALAMAIRNAVFNKPGICVGGCVLRSLCQVVVDTPPSVSTPLLQTLRVWSSFHPKVAVELSSDTCLSHLLRLIQNTSSQAVLSETLPLVVSVLKNSTSSSVLLTEGALLVFMGIFRDHGNNTVARQRQHILKPLIFILYHTTTFSQQLLLLAVAQGVVALLCCWLTHIADLAPISYHRFLVKHVLSLLEGVARLPQHRQEVSQSLPLDDLNTHLLTSEEAAHPVLKLLVTLSALPEFASTLPSSQLLKNVLKLSTTSSAITHLSSVQRVLLHSLKNLVEKTVPENAENLQIFPTDEESFCKENGVLKSPLPPDHKEVKDQKCMAESRTSNTSILHPHVLWSQRESTVLLAVQLRGCTEKHTSSSFTPTAVRFITRVWEQEYQFSIETHAPIKPEACSMTLTGSEVLLKLVKTVSGAWPRLTHSNQKPMHVSIDFNRWEDKDVGILGANDAKRNWSAPAASKKVSYVNPVLTDSDLETDTESKSEEERDEEEEVEEGKGAWQDNLDFGFGD